MIAEQCFACARDDGRCYVVNATMAAIRGALLGAIIGGLFAGLWGLLFGGAGGALLNTLMEGEL